MTRVLQKTKGVVLSEQRVIAKALVLFAVLVFGSGIWGWWHYIQSNPKRVFWGAMENALSTRSFSRVSVQNEGGQIFSQNVFATVAPKQVVSGTNEIKQDGAGGFDVLTNVIGTPTADYVQYSSIETEQKGKDGKSLDYSKVLNLWGKNEAANKQTGGQAYNQSALGVVPFGDLNQSQRRELIDLMKAKSTYKTDFAKTTKKITNGRPTYTYEITVNAEAYISLLKKYASMVGLNQLTQTNPEDFRTTAPLEFKFTVDVWTKQISQIRYASGRTESYGSYGASKNHKAIPSNSLTMDELQQRVQAIQ